MTYFVDSIKDRVPTGKILKAFFKDSIIFRSDGAISEIFDCYEERIEKRFSFRMTSVIKLKGESQNRGNKRANHAILYAHARVCIRV